MKDINRRKFLKNSVLATTSLTIPYFLKGCDKGNHQLSGESDKSLVILQMGGGNDGLNTIVPYRNDLYYKNRPVLGLKSSEVLDLNGELGLNPGLAAMKSLYDNGELSIINNVGYPNPNRSHFRSMDIWHTASESNEYLSTGWLGRYLDTQCQDCNPYEILEMDDNLSLALKGDNQHGFAVSSIDKLKRATKNPIIEAVASHHHDHDHEESVAYLYRTLANTYSTADYLFEQNRIYQTTTDYGQGTLAKSLKQVAELIISGTKTRIYYVSMVGFDTHTNQKGSQKRLFERISQALTGFISDLKANDKFNNTLVMAFSEFGRRVKQNASGGTDHGTASNLYLIGNQLKRPGFYNEGPDLTNLDNGDLIYSVDFRQVYATILDRWLNVNDQGILSRKFDLLDVI